MIEQLMRERRSVRRFKPDKVPRALVERLIAAAITAPSASNKQPWKFLVVENAELRSRMVSAVRAATARIESHIPAASQPAFHAYGEYFTRFEHAPLTIVPIYKSLTLLSNLVGAELGAEDRQAIARMEESSGLIGTSLALQNLLLVAHELGLGASGMTGPLVARAELKAILDVPPAWDIVALVPLGFPDESPPPTDRKDPALVTRYLP